ncbi:hypothetical protein V5F59_04270 [Xanthobacter autotrophicus DSM 431]|uniref:hypothetical protein n=1 Tax=Xanthobacter nonsaccharivorans TaxID=3119912 RepID=UPI003728EF45
MSFPIITKSPKMRFNTRNKTSEITGCCRCPAWKVITWKRAAAGTWPAWSRRHGPFSGADFLKDTVGERPAVGEDGTIKTPDRTPGAAGLGAGLRLGQPVPAPRHRLASSAALNPQQREAGIGFLARTRQTCRAERQVLILRSDARGCSMLVGAINDRRQMAGQVTGAG